MTFIICLNYCKKTKCSIIKRKVYICIFKRSNYYFLIQGTDFSKLTNLPNLILAEKQLLFYYFNFFNPLDSFPSCKYLL